MTVIINDGWLYLSDGTDELKLFVETFKYKYIKKGRLKHYDGGVNLFIPVFKEYLIAVAQGVWLNSVVKVENYSKYLKDWLDGGTFNLKFQYVSGGSYLKLDGDNTIFPVAVKNDLGEIEKISNGDQEFFYVDKLILEQGGTAS
jgi:hypothetical protein